MSKRGSNVLFACSFYTCILNNQVYIQAYLFLNDKDAFNEKKNRKYFQTGVPNHHQKTCKTLLQGQEIKPFFFLSLFLSAKSIMNRFRIVCIIPSLSGLFLRFLHPVLFNVKMSDILKN